MKEIRKESVTIEWKPPADDGGLELSKYSVEKCDVEKMVWMKVIFIKLHESMHVKVKEISEREKIMIAAQS